MDDAGASSRAPDASNELYLLPPAAFTAARDEHAARARQAGNRDTAAALARLRRPSVGAWLVNLVALTRPDLIDELIELGHAIRRAQGSVPPAQLRDLSDNRRRVLNSLLAQARALATDQGGPALAKPHLAEAESTFAAAMADDETARLVRSGRVLKAVTYTGFGQPAEVGSAVPAPPVKVASATPAASAPQAAQTAHEAETITTAEIAHAAARDRVERASAELATAARAEKQAAQRVDRVAAQLAELRRELDAARRAALDAGKARAAAERALASAERRLRRHLDQRSP